MRNNRDSWVLVYRFICQSIAQHLHLSIAAIDFKYPYRCSPVPTVVYLQKLLGHTNLLQIVL